MIRKILLPSLLLIAEPAFAQIHDVGVVSIDSPPDIVEPWAVHTPMATVNNFGDFTETFTVTCRISPGVYADQTQVDSLAPGEQVQVSFLDWDVPPFECQWYRMDVFTSLSGDTNPGNDSLFALILGAAHEVGVVSIDGPPDTVFADSTYLPAATVKNLGFVNETFEVECLIDSSGLSVYGDTVQVTDLPPSTSFPCTFGVWTVPPSDSTAYSMTVSLLPSYDCDPSNNSLQRPILAYRLVGVGEKGEASVREVFFLLEAKPNPMCGVGEVLYQLPRDSWVEVKVYSAEGRLVRELVAEAERQGFHKVVWDGQDTFRRRVASGMYFCRLTAGDFKATNKMVLLR